MRIMRDSPAAVAWRSTRAGGTGPGRASATPASPRLSASASLMESFASAPLDTGTLRFLGRHFTLWKSAQRIDPHGATNVEVLGCWDTVGAFGLFRLFDVWKPFPIRQFEARVKGGFGVMLDDLLAACYAYLVLAVAVIVMHRVALSP